MKPKMMVKICVDVSMTVLFLFQMGYHMLDNRAHEWLGVTLCLLFILHHALNGGWHARLFKGKYNASRIMLTAIDVLLTLAMVSIIASSIMVSRHVYSFLGLRMRALGRQIHMPATMWAFVLMGLHLGLHWSMFLGTIKRARKGKAAKAAVVLARVALICICAFGAYEFIARELWMELFMLREFAFLDYGETLLTFLTAYIAILAVWVALSHYLGKAVKRLGRRIRKGVSPMKRVSFTLALLIALVCVSAPVLSEENPATNRILIAYFTWADNTTVADAEASIDSALEHYGNMGDSQSGVDATTSASVLVPGNTAIMAGYIHDTLGGDLFSIQAEEPYPSDYDECLDRAADELDADARPELKTHVEDMDQYDIVFLGMPNWWYSCPRAILAFVEEYDFSGKTLIPFVAHGTGGISGSVRDMRRSLPDDCAVLDPIGVYRPDTLSSKPRIEQWINELGLDFISALSE